MCIHGESGVNNKLIIKKNNFIYIKFNIKSNIIIQFYFYIIRIYIYI